MNTFDFALITIINDYFNFIKNHCKYFRKEPCKKDNLNYISKLVMELCEPYRTVFYNKIYLELSYKEIGKEYGKNEN